MRPQRFSCGIRSAALPASAASICFNEAAAFQLRNLEDHGAEVSGSYGFNEAAAFQLRNHAGRRDVVNDRERLQ